MNNLSLKILVTLTAIAGIVCYGFIDGLSQSGGGLNKRYFFDQSTSFEAVMQYDHDLVVVGQHGIDSSGLQGIVVARIDTLGNIQKVDLYRDPMETDHLLVNAYTYDAIMSTSSDGLIIAGSTANKDNLFLLKMNESLEVDFFREYESNFKARFVKNIIHIDDFYYVTGMVQELTADLAIFVQKVDMAGNQIWEKTFGHPEYWNNGGSVVIENGGLTIILGEWYDPNRFLPNDTRRWTHFIHIDTSGGELWQWKSQENEESGSPASLVMNNSLYFYTTRPAFEMENNDIWFGTQIVCRDSLFNLVWRNDYSDIFGFFNGFNDLTMGHDGYLYATGQIADGALSARICKIDPLNGEVLWEARDTGIYTPGFGSRNQMQGITVLPSGSVVAVGSTYDPVTFDYHGLLLKTTKDGCIDTLCTTSVIDDFVLMQSRLVKVYPNPASQYFYMEVDKDKRDLIAELFDLNGTMIVRQEINGGRNMIMTGDRLPGMYIWRVVSKDERLVDSGKIIISG